MKVAIALFFAIGVLLSRSAISAPEDDVKASFERFVTAQNAHDANAVRDLLLDSPNFLWITRGTTIWGRDAAMQRFETYYQGTWRKPQDPHAGRQCCAALRRDHVHDRCSRTAPSGRTCVDEPDMVENAGRLACGQHPSNTGFVTRPGQVVPPRSNRGPLRTCDPAPSFGEPRRGAARRCRKGCFVAIPLIVWLLSAVLPQDC
jgi:hypothetical protein